MAFCRRPFAACLILLLALALSTAKSEGDLLGAAAAPAVTLDCGGACAVRCSNNWRNKMCRKMCGICCGKCRCVPSGTSVSTRAQCPCYASMTNRRGQLKCP